MKTVKAELSNVDPGGRHDPAAGVRPLGRLNVDQCLRHVDVLPREVGQPAPGEDPAPPGIRFDGRSGMWLELCRKDPGHILRLTMKDGEEDHRLTELLALQRVRLFVQHWGEDTEVTEEFRLPPEIRAQLAARDRRIDEERRSEAATGPERRVFARRTHVGLAAAVWLVSLAVAGALGAAFLLAEERPPVALAAAGAVALVAGSFVARRLAGRRHEVVVNRGKGAVSEHQPRGEARVFLFQDLAHADVAGLVRPGAEGGVPVLVLARAGKEGEERLAPGFSAEETIEIARAINDALGVPEQKRKLLRYRKFERKRGT